jgi:uncharacterized protein
MNRKIIAAFVALALLAGCAGAQSTRAAADDSAHAAPGPALYVIHDPDSTMYLYGTIHLRKTGEPWGSAAVDAAIASADEVWTELEISPEADARTQALVPQYGLAPAGHPLSSWLNEADRARLNEVTARLGLPAQALEPMQPWLAAVTLTVVPMLRAGYDPNAGVDHAVAAFAAAHAKHARWFETAAEQFGFFSNLSADMQRQILLDAIDESEQGAEVLDQTSAAWEQGDTAAVDRLVNDELRQRYPEVYEVLIKRRNDAWVQTLLHELQGSGVDFVAVGAGHIVGSDGLVAQLRAHGLHVERVSAAASTSH